jgi:hypothetical protein
MIRHSSIAAGLLFLALQPSLAASDERPLYLESVLYAGESERATPDFLVALADSAPTVAPTAAPDTTRARADTLGAGAAIPPAPKLRQPSIILPLTGGAVMGAGMAYALGWAGVLLAGEGESSDDLDARAAFLLGGFVGEVTGVALGTPLGNGAKGSFARNLGISVLTGAIGVAAASGGGAAGGIAGAALQLGATLAVERHAAREKWREHAAARGQ